MSNSAEHSSKSLGPQPEATHDLHLVRQGYYQPELVDSPFRKAMSPTLDLQEIYSGLLNSFPGSG